MTQEEPISLDLDSILSAIRNSHVEQEETIEEATTQNLRLSIKNSELEQKVDELTSLLNQTAKGGDKAIQSLTMLKGEIKRLKEHGDPKSLYNRVKNTKKKNEELTAANKALRSQVNQQAKEIKRLKALQHKAEVVYEDEEQGTFIMVMPFAQNVCVNDRVTGEQEKLNARPVLAWWSKHGVGRYIVPDNNLEPIVANSPEEDLIPDEKALDFARGLFMEKLA